LYVDLVVPRRSAFDAHHLAQRMYQVHQVLLRQHHRVDVLAAFCVRAVLYRYATGPHLDGAAAFLLPQCVVLSGIHIVSVLW
jgi:hypothetical protein